MINSLLYSRMECGYPSNEEFFDEDVNVYIANLLTSVIYPQFTSNSVKYVIPYDTLLYDNLRLIDNPRIKYELYRANADHILLTLGIFKNPRGKRPTSRPYLDLSEKAYIGRAKVYYSLAQSYSQAVFRKSTAISDVLGKLSYGFEKYLRVVSTMSVDYLNFIKKLSPGELFHLNNSINGLDLDKKKAGLYDEFLDALSEFKRKKTRKSMKKLEEAIENVKRVDPAFSFKLPTLRGKKLS